MPRHTYTVMEIRSLVLRACNAVLALAEHPIDTPQFESAAGDLHGIANELCIAAGQARRAKQRRADRAARKVQK